MQAQFMDLPVIDQTGLGDTRYTFMVKFTPDPGMRPFGGAAPPPQAQPASPDPEAPPDLFSAMETCLIGGNIGSDGIAVAPNQALPSSMCGL